MLKSKQERSGRRPRGVRASPILRSSPSRGGPPSLPCGAHYPLSSSLPFSLSLLSARALPSPRLGTRAPPPPSPEGLLLRGWPPVRQEQAWHVKVAQAGAKRGRGQLGGVQTSSHRVRVSNGLSALPWLSDPWDGEEHAERCGGGGSTGLGSGTALGRRAFLRCNWALQGPPSSSSSSLSSLALSSSWPRSHSVILASPSPCTLHAGPRLLFQGGNLNAHGTELLPVRLYGKKTRHDVAACVQQASHRGATARGAFSARATAKC